MNRACSLAAVLTVLGLSLLAVGPARADGEAGLVIQDGASVRTFCVAFKGDGITGSELLESAGVAYEQVGGGGRTVCSIGGTGCFNAGDFASCFCQCQGANCTYWAFFTQRYGGGWVYASLAFNLLKAKDGELQGWKWGKGSPNSAPAPNGATFESVCGHAPRGGAVQPPPPVPPPTVAPTPFAPTLAPAAPGSTTPVAAATTAPNPTLATPAANDIVTVTVSPALSPTSRSQGGTPAPQPTRPGPAPTILPPATGVTRDEENGSTGGLIAFAAIAGALLIATGAAVTWRRRHGP